MVAWSVVRNLPRLLLPGEVGSYSRNSGQPETGPQKRRP